MRHKELGLLDKTAIANVAALMIVIAAVGYLIYMRETETLKAVLLTATGYLFGVTAGYALALRRSLKRER